VESLQNTSLQMKDRISLLIKAKNLTAAQFADEIGVQKSSISHILSGRNNASLDFIQKILVSYPEVSMEWILFGKGPIFRSTETATNVNNDVHLNTVHSQELPPVDLFSDLATDKPAVFRKENDFKSQLDPEENIKRDDHGNQFLASGKESFGLKSEIKNGIPETKIMRSENRNNSTKSILKIVEFYSDNTYREFFPNN
jgi:transcriptional regulator with XRE-family HTH domain